MSKTFIVLCLLVQFNFSQDAPISEPALVDSQVVLDSTQPVELTEVPVVDSSTLESQTPVEASNSVVSESQLQSIPEENAALVASSAEEPVTIQLTIQADTSASALEQQTSGEIATNASADQTQQSDVPVENVEVVGSALEEAAASAE